jgi:antitoxin (DNA-binding transcriptional repressor) of toxin-antitoxin stability system
MVSTIGRRERCNDNARIIDAVAAGRSFVVTRHGPPMAEPRPVEERG